MATPNISEYSQNVEDSAVQDDQGWNIYDFVIEMVAVIEHNQDELDRGVYDRQYYNPAIYAWRSDGALCEYGAFA